MQIEYKEKLGRYIITVLKPLMRMLIKNAITHTEFAELAKHAYTDVCYEQFSIPGSKTTISRVAVLTGLSRKEVVRLNKLRESNRTLEKTSPNRAMRVVNGWTRDEEFLDNEGQPLVLALQGEHGSFSSLVARYSGDITLGAVADELERTGVIIRKNDTVALANLGYLPNDSELEKIGIMSVCVADLIDTSVHNLESSKEKARLQRQIIYKKVPQGVAEEFKKYSAKKSAMLLQDFNRFLSKRISNQKNTDADNKRVGLGIYYIENTYINTETNEGES